jgi:4-amino-4-deoxy-L-arabinose transferase-like glycosyltransferase
MAALFGMALSLRLAWVLALLTRHPELVKYPSIDGAFYHSWAKDILNGTGASQQVFFAHPLYPHVIAALYKVFAVETLVVILFQCFLGAASCLMMVKLVRPLFSEAGGWTADSLKSWLSKQGMVSPFRPFYLPTISRR